MEIKEDSKQKKLKLKIFEQIVHENKTKESIVFEPSITWVKMHKADGEFVIEGFDDVGDL